MKDEQLDFGIEVICTELSTVECCPQDPIFNEATCRFRDVGHIGTVVSVFPHYDAVLVSHREYNDGLETEFLTAYHTHEIELFDPPRLIESTPLAKAIKLIQITRE